MTDEQILAIKFYRAMKWYLTHGIHRIVLSLENGEIVADIDNQIRPGDPEPANKVIR